MAEPRITIIDVARAASVHPSTVSRVLNGRAELSLLPETRDRVTAAAKRLGYRPSALARSLRLRRTFTLGMLVPDITNPFFPPIIKGVEDTAQARGYNLMLCNTMDSPEREATYLRVLRERQVDGLLIASSFMADSTIAQLRAEKFPYVLLNRAPRGGEDLAVLPDNRAGVTSAIEHLIELGHRRIGLVAIAERFSEEAGYRAAWQLLRGIEPPTAIFGANDLIALGALRVAREAGLGVPRDLSIVGFNDIPLAELLEPPLTTVRVPQQEMGVEAATLLIAQLDGEAIPRRRVVLEANLIVRGSTAVPRISARKTA